MPDLMSPFTTAVSFVLAASHDAAGAIGLAPGSAGAWLVALLLLVVAVRTLLLPITIHGVRASHARAHAAPQLRELRARYAGSRDLAQLTAMREEQKRIHAEHGVSSWSLAPVLLQVPIFYAVYRVVSDLAAGQSVGALDVGLVASASAASVLGLHLTSHLGPVLSQSLPAALVMVAVAVAAATLSLATQRWFVLPMTDPTDLPEVMGSVQRLMPWVGAVGILAAAGFVPAGLLIYWLLNNLWTFVQQGLVWRFAPTPGSPAAARRAVAA